MHVPEGSRLRPDATLNYLKLAVTRALFAQMNSPSDWRDIAGLTDTEHLMKSVHTDETFLEVIIDKIPWRDDEYDAAVREFVPHLLGVNAVRIPGVDLIATPTRLPALENRLHLPEWLTENEPDLYARLYARNPEELAAPQPVMDLDAVLAVMDSVSANLERLQAIWDRACPLLPTGPSGDSTNEYDDLVRAWSDLLKGLPSIEGWTITDPIPGMAEIGMMYVDYMEIGEPPLGVFAAKEQPDKDLAEYRYRLSRARRRVIRDRLLELTGKLDNLLPQMLVDVARDDQALLEDTRVAVIIEAITEIERLMGDTAARQGRWSDLHRHIRFGQGHDWHDIHEFDWPSVKKDIEAAGFSEADPLPVPEGIDLGRIASSKPTGKASTALQWDVLDSTQFERLLYDLARVLPGYRNVQLLMKTNAADRGRDVSAERVTDDGAGGVRSERVIIQAKHWLSKSVPPFEINNAVTTVTLWEPPVVRVLIVATSGHFTPDAVAWTEKHNEAGKQPWIDLWPESRLSTLLSERPYLVAEYSLR